VKVIFANWERFKLNFKAEYTRVTQDHQEHKDLTTTTCELPMFKLAQETTVKVITAEQIKNCLTRRTCHTPGA
jgi:hypothetical protein